MASFDENVHAYLVARLSYAMRMKRKATDDAMLRENDHTMGTLQYWIVACKFLNECLGTGNGFETFVANEAKRIEKENAKCL